MVGSKVWVEMEKTVHPLLLNLHLNPLCLPRRGRGGRRTRPPQQTTQVGVAGMLTPGQDRSGLPPEKVEHPLHTKDWC